MTLHSPLGASSAYRWLKCPGSFRLSESAPARPMTIHAATGVLAHRLIESGLRGGGRFYLSALTGGQLPVPGYPDPIEVTRDLLDGVQVMIDYVEDRIAGSTWYDFEFQVSLDSYFKTPPPVPVFGTLDAAVLTGVELEIIDYKNGAGVFVSPIENPQLMFYAAGVLPNLPVGAVQRIKATIVQPHAPGEKIRSWIIDPVDLAMWVDDVLVPGVAAAADASAPLVPGSWCRFCPVSQACPALHAAAVDLAQKQFDDVAAPSDPDDLASLLDTAEKAELWIARLREFCKAALERGTLIPGWGLIPTRPTRKWLLDDSSIAARLVALGLDPTTIFDNRLRSPAQIDTILHKSRAGTKIWTDVAPMIESRSSGSKVGRTGPPAKDEFNDGEELP